MCGGVEPVVRAGVFTEIVENCSRQELMPITKGQLLAEITIDTDGRKSCDSLVLVDVILAVYTALNAE